NLIVNINGENSQSISGTGSIELCRTIQKINIDGDVVLNRDLTISCPMTINGTLHRNGFTLIYTARQLNSTEHITDNTEVTLTDNQSANNVQLPSGYSISQNYPNPFNPGTKIDYTLPVSGKVSIKVYDMNGREAAVLVDKNQDAGSYTAQFDASKLSSGVYFYTITTSN